MKTLTVALPGREYDILIAAGLLKEAGARCRAVLPRAKKLFVVTDSNVAPLYLRHLIPGLEQAGFETAVEEIPAGEGSKSAAMLTRLWEDMMDFGLTRTDAVVALGGGVVGDLAGFAAATILRGVDFVQIPTTLLSQVDSSVGGKVAIDLDHGKNLAGAFYSFLEQRPSRAQVMGEIEHVLYICCDLKRRVVLEDERDTGARMLLNFGHTLGHAYELAGHYEKWTHGQAVAAGMVKAAELGTAMDVTPQGTAQRIGVLLGCFGLPLEIPCTAEDYAAAVGLDKKGAGADINLILLEQLGRAVPHRMPKDQLLALL